MNRCANACGRIDGSRGSVRSVLFRVEVLRLRNWCNGVGKRRFPVPGVSRRFCRGRYWGGPPLPARGRVAEGGACSATEGKALVPLLTSHNERAKLCFAMYRFQCSAVSGLMLLPVQSPGNL
jgi:hypothetical protein